MERTVKRANGFTMIEMLFTAFIFTVISGTVFSLLLASQRRYQSESNLTTAFQQANVAIDQITRDVHSAGYPSASSFNEPSTMTYHPELIALPFAWSSGYPSTPCTVGATCTIPGDYDLILEADVGNGLGVQWIRYSLSGTTLMRGMVSKSTNPTDPVGATNGALTPYLDNVMNGPGNKSKAIFSYTPDRDASGSYPLSYAPSNIREVNICLVVQSAKPDPQTGQLRSITLTGQAIRFNPNK
jgi:type II secretory pathway pseudopilin PulG